MVSLSPTEHPAMILMKICRHLVLKYSTKAAIVLMVADSTSCATFLLIFLSMANPTVRRSTHRASRRSSSPSSGPGKQSHAHRHCTTAQTSMLRSTSCPSARVSAGSGVETTSTSLRIRRKKKPLTTAQFTQAYLGVCGCDQVYIRARHPDASLPAFPD